MARVYVSIGSNIDRERSVRQGVAGLREAFGPLTLSPVYETAAVGFEGDDFYNLVAGFDTGLSPQEVAGRLRAIEDATGRDRSQPRFSPRTLDLDLLLYDDAVLREQGLRIPRDEILKYAFVLKPLADIAGGLRHPECGETYAALWARFEGDRGLRPVALDLGD